MAQTDKQQSQETSATRGFVVTVDYDRYAKFFSDENDMSDDEKLEFVQALWEIMLQLAVYGVRFEPENADQKACGQAQQIDEKSPSPTLCKLESLDQKISTEFKTASTSETTLAVGKAGS